ncbi:MAG: HEPN domain-containing protein [Ignavibacteriaceae bacterium]
MNLPEKEKQFLISYNIEKADTAINDAKFLADNKKIYASYNRIYYACFYILSALGLKDNFSTSKHKQLIGWFNKKYVKMNIVDKK